MMCLFERKTLKTEKCEFMIATIRKRGIEIITKVFFFTFNKKKFRKNCPRGICNGWQINLSLKFLKDSHFIQLTRLEFCWYYCVKELNIENRDDKELRDLKTTL